MKQKLQTFTLSDNQQGIFFETISRSQPVYISQMCLIFEGLFNHELFQQAYLLVINRHEILRAAFYIDKTKIDPVPIKIVYENIEPLMTYYDYTSLKKKEKNKLYQRLIETDLITPFNFDRPSLMRVAIIRYSKKEYRVIWTRHHILLDGQSVKLILTELLTMYKALLNNKPWKLPSSSSYIDHKEKFYAQDQAKAAQYWKQQLSYFSKSSFLPAIPTIKSSSNNFSHVFSKLSGEDYQLLSKFVSHHELSINSILQAAWGIILFQYSNNKHVIFGSVRSYPREKVKNCAGLFINTLPLALTIKPKMKVLFFLKIVRKQGKLLRDYVYTSLSDIRKWCGLSLEGLLYQSIIDYKPYSLNKIIKEEFSELHCEISLTLTTPYPLALEVVNEGDHLSIRLNYNIDLFTKQIAEGLIEHFQTIIRECCLNPSKNLFALPTLTSEDWQESVVSWNNTKKKYPLDKTLNQYFEEQVKKTPKATAIVYNDYILNYEMLNNKANQIAYFLLHQGLKSEAFIIILTESNPNIILSLLAILKAGGAYVPIDINYPIERIKYFINDSGAEIIICDNSTNQLLNQILASLTKPITLINLDTIPIQNLCTSNPKLYQSSSHLAYMIYTSGSTGMPKGVLVEHKSVLNMTLGCIDRLKITEESRILQIASFGFDVAVAEWSLALLSGASLYLMDKTIFNPTAIVAALERYKITAIILASSILTALPHKNLPNLKVIAVGGEPCGEAVINYWAKFRLFLNVYGITETTVCTTIATCYTDQVVLSIGKPLPNCQIYILNNYLQPLPRGVYGEIYVGGKGLARGYWNNDELTKEKFIKNPFLDELVSDDFLQSNRLYKTGDKGRWLANGELEFLGRVDNQVKVMGIRIELLEVEKAIEQYPAIEKAAVILSKNKQLEAFILSDEKNLNLEKVKQFLRTILPSSLIPSHFIACEKFPLTSNGKINIEELISYSIRKEPNKIKEEQLTKTEEMILTAIKNIMNTKRVNLNQNFLDIGLKSINLVELSVKLSAQFQQEVSVISLFNYPSIKTLANYLDGIIDSHSIEENIVLKESSVPVRKSKPKIIEFKNDDNN
ncbi:MAG: amino acid adenylation domain-containing protein [Tatlockia sp.]|nr:amino acid adenylation domain-containing protein [Tatlockia sp.]